VGECSRSDRQHSGKDQSENLRSVHYTNPSFTSLGPLRPER
jgi:hypothetical protein